MQNRKYTKPAALAKGDTIGIISPASGFFSQNIRNGVQHLRRLGFKVKLPETLFDYRRYTVREDKRKAQEINRMFKDPSVKAIFCAKGGYGCIRLLPHLDQELIAKHPKIFMGYSDVSFLLNFLIANCGMVCFHGPMIVGEIYKEMPHIKQEEMLTALTGSKPLGRLTHKNSTVLCKGKASGILVGGCLTSLVRTLGTPYEMDTTGVILFLEDVSETPTNIEEMLFHLKIAGKLDKVNGIVFGQMYNCGSLSVLAHRIETSLADLGIPILMGFPSGHSFSNITLPLGVRVTLDAGSTKRPPGIVIRERAVA